MTEEKKQRIKNKLYREFLDAGIIVTLNEKHIEQACKNAVECKYRGLKNPEEARALILMLYYTGARPNEVLRLKGKDVSLNGKYLHVKLSASKGGLPRTAFLPMKRPLVDTLWKYCAGFFDEMYLFYHFFSNNVRRRQTLHGVLKVDVVHTDSLRYWFKKWFDGILEVAIPPYYLRHNRFSKLVEAGISLEDARMLKGSKTFESIVPYLHMSSKAAKNIARKME